MHCAFRLLSLLISAKYVSLGPWPSQRRYFHTHNPFHTTYVELFTITSQWGGLQWPIRGFPNFFNWLAAPRRFFGHIWEPVRFCGACICICIIRIIVLYCNILHIVLLIFAFASAQTILPLERNIYNKHLSWQETNHKKELWSETVILCKSLDWEILH